MWGVGVGRPVVDEKPLAPRLSGKPVHLQEVTASAKDDGGILPLLGR
jgi:hypothetical protein